jgi:hypothetical protein
MCFQKNKQSVWFMQGEKTHMIAGRGIFCNAYAG